MAYRDLREFMALLEKRQLLARVEAQWERYGIKM